VLRLAASPYIAGERREQALQKAQELSRRRRLHSTVDVLGEDVHDWDGVREYFDEYQRLVDDLAGLQHANISIKLSALGQQIDEDRCFQHALSLVARAAARGTFVRLDMEDSSTTDSTLRIYRRLRGLHDNCGVVLQSRLFRTAKDVEALADLRPNVRLCIGIYREPPDLALQDKPEMKRRLLELLPTMWRNGQHVALATHEEWVIREALELAKQLGKPEREVEVQMLLGVPREGLQRELVDRGIRVRLYVPYGKHWRAYSMRRLENNPDVMRMVAGNVVKGMLGRR
jgi:proline dehydrogenase